MNERLYRLDAWRALLLSLGPVFHTSIIGLDLYPHAGWMGIIAVTIHSFRMEAFFAIAGFLMSYRRGPLPPEWLRQREKRLLIPLLTCWITVVPLSKIFASWRLGTGYDWSPFDPQYLWFLLTLLVVTPVLWRASHARRMDDLVGLLQSKPLFWCGAVALAIFLAAVGRLALHVLPHRNAPAMIVPLTFAAAPYYGIFCLAGFVAARSQGMMTHLAHGSLWLVGPVVLLIYLVLVYQFDAAPGGHAPINGAIASMAVHGMKLLALVFVAAAMTYTVLALGVRPLKPRRFISVFNDAAFTIFLFHMLPLEALAFAFGHKVHSFMYFATVSISSLLLSLFFHFLVVKRFPTVSFLFNGDHIYRKKT